MSRLVLSLLAACSFPHHAGSDPPDAIVDTGSPNTVTVKVAASTKPIVFAYRDGLGPWLQPDPVSDDMYALHVDDDYEVLIGCSTSLGFDTALVAATFADGAQFIACGPSLSAAPSVAVTGQMAQAGSVWMQDQATSAMPAWSFDLSVTPGTHDLIAASPDRIAIQRDLPITGPLTLPALDLTQTGLPLTSVPVTITNPQGDELSSELDLDLDHDSAFLPGTGTAVVAPPRSLLAPTDRQLLWVSATSATTSRYADTTFDGNPTMFTLMPALDGVTFTATDPVSAAWGPLPAYTEVLLEVYDNRGTQRVRATKRWLEATGATKLAFDVDPVPAGFDRRWAIHGGDPHGQVFDVVDDSGPVFYSSSVFGSINGFTARSHARAAEARATRRPSGPARSSPRA